MLHEIKTIFHLALTFFILMNAIGNSSFFLSLLKGISTKRQKQIVLRELIISLFVITVFYFIGTFLLKFLMVTQDILQISGGIILFLLALKMLFPAPYHEKAQTQSEFKKITEPFIVPFAIPLIAGPAVLAAVMLYSHQVSTFIMMSAVIISWIATLGVLLASASLSKWLGDRGIMAIERLMGFVMVLIAMQMFLSGLKSFMKS